MQFTMTTDYALRIVTYLSQKGDVVTTSQLSNELQIPMNYIPKIIKNLKNKKNNLCNRRCKRWLSSS